MENKRHMQLRPVQIVVLILCILGAAALIRAVLGGRRSDSDGSGKKTTITPSPTPENTSTPTPEAASPTGEAPSPTGTENSFEPRYVFRITDELTGESKAIVAPLPYVWRGLEELQERKDDKGMESLVITAFPEVKFVWEDFRVKATENGEELLNKVYARNAFVDDITGDGYPDFCVIYSQGDGIVRTYITVLDFRNHEQYGLGSDDYTYYVTRKDGKMTILRRGSSETSWEPDLMEDAVYGHVAISDGKLVYVVDDAPEEPESVEAPISNRGTWTWFDESTGKADAPRKVVVPGLSEYTFRLQNGWVWWFHSDGHRQKYMEPVNAFFADLNSDGHPELCMTNAGYPPREDERFILVWDIQNGKCYRLPGETENSYRLFMQDDVLMVCEKDATTGAEVSEPVVLSGGSFTWTIFDKS